MRPLPRPPVRPLARVAALPAGDWFDAPDGRSDAAPALSVSDTLAGAAAAPLQAVFTQPPPDRPARMLTIVAPLLLDRPYATDPREGPVAERYWILNTPP